MSEVFTDGGRADKNMKLVARVVGGIILVIVLLLMFVINPHVNNDKFTNETLWEAVHPFHWLWDSIGVIGTLFTFAYLCGVAGKVVYRFTEPKTENSSGLIHIVAAVCGLLMLCYYI